MAHIKRKYIDSHWLVFVVQGALALVFGWLILFTGMNQVGILMALISVFLICLGIVELFNALNRHRKGQGWFVAVIVALIDVAMALILFLTIERDMTWHLIFLAIYTILRGVFELVLGFKTTVDPTDRFIWILCGICGAVMGFGILNSGHLLTVDFVRFFGAYLLVFGFSNMIYGIHNRSQKQEDHEARLEAASKHKKVAKRKPAKKVAKKR